MPDLPIRPHFKSYGRSVRTRDKSMEFNRMAQRIADHVHRLILDNARDVQVYSYFRIAQDLGLETKDVSAAIGRGGSNGITFGVDATDREAIESDLRARGVKR